VLLPACPDDFGKSSGCADRDGGLKRSALMPAMRPWTNPVCRLRRGNWRASWASRLDAAIVTKLHDEVIAILATPDMKERSRRWATT